MTTKPVTSVVALRAVDRGAPSTSIELDGGRPHAAARAGGIVDVSCRALDLVGATLLLIVLSPLLLAIALAVRLDSPGPAIFRQRRFGRDLRPFDVHKFRTMHYGVPEDQHKEFVLRLISGQEPELEAARPQYKMTQDPRVTRVGRLLRRSSLDELPQLWNVLRGEMSLVGPRPPIPYEVERYPAHWYERFAVKPGVTGLWQVGGRSDVTLEQMVALDVEYIRRRSLWLNLTILARTLPAVLSARGAW